tara:strand:+ start:484 stop:780 length:297 start_codon:yes stop_codon:yes gene_type:complete
MRKQYKTLVCNSGFTVSVQASETNYCTPRNNVGPYTEVELGFPSATEPLIIGWAEDPGNPTGTVYGWVPTTVLFEVITKHGGIASGELPPTHMSPKRF